jgi:hypothetical protein
VDSTQNHAAVESGTWQELGLRVGEGNPSQAQSGKEAMNGNSRGMRSNILFPEGKGRGVVRSRETSIFRHRAGGDRMDLKW